MSADRRTEFLRAALWFGVLGNAEQVLAAHPALATSDIRTAAALGDAEVDALLQTR